MKLLTSELRKKLPALGATEKQENPTAICKFFTPDGSWTWFAFEFDGRIHSSVQYQITNSNSGTFRCPNWNRRLDRSACTSNATYISSRHCSRRCVSNMGGVERTPQLEFFPMVDLVGVSPELIGSVSFGGLRAYGLGYAVDPDTEATIYLSLVGYRTAVRGVWAALMDHRAVEIANQVLRRAEGTYLSRTVQLAESGLDHMVLLHHQAAIGHLEAGQTFFVLNNNDTPPIERFVAMLDRATAVPLLQTWGTELWKRGMKNKLIEPLADTRGVEGWRVSADSELWLALIEKGIQRGTLKVEAE